MVTSRRSIARGPVDELLASEGRHRSVVAVVPSFATALAMCVGTELTTLVPSRLAAVLARSSAMRVFRPPLRLPTVEVSVVWHTRSTADPVHRWLRSLVAEVATTVPGPSPVSAAPPPAPSPPA